MQTLSTAAIFFITTAAANNFWWLDKNVFSGERRNNKSYNDDDSAQQQVTAPGDNRDNTRDKPPCNQLGINNCNPAKSSNKQGGSLALPITQGLQKPSSQGSQGKSSSQCPDVLSLPRMSECGDTVSQCWSPGDTDPDCPDSGLCCFTGCVNVCMRSSAPRRPEKQTLPASSDNDDQNSGVNGLEFPPPNLGYNNNEDDYDEEITDYDQASSTSSGVEAAKSSPEFQDASSASANQPQPQQSRPRPANNNNNNNNNNSNNNSRRDQGLKPYVRCPSAMKCVEKINCDFDGFMTDDVLDLTPELEMLRVPLIPCVNRARGNQIDVCCRDPNYKDPWPQNNNNNQPQQQQQGRNSNQNSNNQGRNQNPNQNFNNQGRNADLPADSNAKQKPATAPKRRKNSYGK